MQSLLDGKVALVTGAGQGLGRATAQLFSRDGAKVVIADINDEKGEETAKLICDNGGEAIFVHADITQSAEVQALVRMTVDRFGGLDCAVNNALALIPSLPLAEIDEADWDRSLAVNLHGVFLCMKYEIRAMLERRGGAIVNIGSGREFSAIPGHAWYLGAKQAVYGMTKCAALEYGAKGVRINAVAPGVMWTPAFRGLVAKTPSYLEDMTAHVPLGWIAQPEEVAEAVVWLCSPRASYVHGATLSADGGFVLGP